MLLDPPFKPQTWALWAGPPLMAGAIVFLIVLSFRSWQSHKAGQAEVEPLSPTDRAALDALVERIARDAPPPLSRSAFRTEFDEPRTPPRHDTGHDSRPDTDTPDGSARA